MVHKKYTYRNGRRYGPYFYENKRVNGTVVTTYLGKSAPKSSGKKPIMFGSVAVIVFFALLLMLFFTYSSFSDSDGGIAVSFGELYGTLTGFSVEGDDSGSDSGGDSGGDFGSDSSSGSDSGGDSGGDSSSSSSSGGSDSDSGGDSDSSSSSGSSGDSSDSSEGGSAESSDDSDSGSSESSSDGGDSSSDSGADESDSGEADDSADTGQTGEESDSDEGSESEGSEDAGSDAGADDATVENDGEDTGADESDGAAGEDVAQNDSTDEGDDVSDEVDEEIIIPGNESESEEDETGQETVDETNESASSSAGTGEVIDSLPVLDETVLDDVVNQSVNETTPSVINETNETVIVNDTTSVALTIGTVQYGAVLGQPVRWVKQIDTDGPASLIVEIPEIAENVSVSASVDPSVDSEQDESVEIEEDAVGEETEQESASGEDVSDSAPEITVSLTGNAILDTRNGGTSGSFSAWIENFFTRLGTLTGFVVSNETSQTEEVQEIPVDITDDEEIVEIEYYTEAPYAVEQEIPNGKEVVIVGPDEVHYEDVLAFTVFPETFELTDPSLVEIYWKENNSYIQPTRVLDSDENGIYDYIEWVVPHLSNQTFEIIVITDALHLDENRTLISDIFEDVKELDGNWSEEIPDGHYVRVTFEKNLTSGKDITIYPRTGNESLQIEVYEFNESVLLALFDTVTNDTYNTIYLTNLTGEQDTFDLRIRNGSVIFDHIIDPTAPDETTFFENCSDISDWTVTDCWAVTSNTCRCTADGTEENMTSVTIDLSGQESANLTFEWVTSFALSHYFRVYADDGASGYTELFSQVSSSGNGNESFLLEDHISLTSDVTIRAACKTVGRSSNYCQWDNINITAQNITGSQVEFVAPTPANDATVEGTNFYVNVSSDDVRDHYTFVDFNDSLKLWVRMDDVNSSGDVLDISGNGNNGTVIADTVINDSARWGDSAFFDGTGDYIHVLDSDSLDVEYLTLAAWINTEAGDSFARIVQKDSSYILYYLEASDRCYGNLYNETDSAVWVSALNSAPHGEWIHCVLVYNGTWWGSYVNGTLSWEDSGTPDLTGPLRATTNNLSIGATAIGVNPITGSIDDVLLFNRALDASEIAALYNATATQYAHNFEDLAEGAYSFRAHTVNVFGNRNQTGERNVTLNLSLTTIPPNIEFVNPTLSNDGIGSGDSLAINVSSSDSSDHYVFVDLNESLMFWMRMDDVNSTGGAIDLSRFGSNGTLVGDATINDSGYWGNGSSYDQSGDYITVADPSDGHLDFGTDSFSVSAWFNAHSAGAGSDWRDIVSKKAGGGTNTGWVIRMDDSNVLEFFMGDGSSTRVYESGVVSHDEWHHVVAFVDSSASVMGLYVDGVFNGTAAAIGSLSNSDELRIGTWGDGGNPDYWNGIIDEVIIFNRTLNETEVAALYNASASQYDSNISVGDGNYSLIAYTADSYGNKNQTETRSVSIDGTRPLVAYGEGTRNNETISADTAIYVNVTVTEAFEDRITFRLYNTTGEVNTTAFTDKTRTINWTDLVDGRYTYNVSVNDSANNINTTETYVLMIDTANPNVSFVDPTLSNNTLQVESAIFVNVSSGDVSDRMSFVDFNGDLGLWLGFDEINDTGHPTDLSNHSNNGTAVNGPSQTNEGRIGNAFAFASDNNDYVSIPTHESLEATENMTVSFWVNATGGTGDDSILSKATGLLGWCFAATNNGFHAAVDDTNPDLIVHMCNGTLRQIATLPGLRDTWHHIALTHNSTTYDVYVDGEHNQSFSLTGTVNTSTDLILGSTTNSLAFHGQLDELHYFARTLTPQEIQTLYNTTTGYQHNYTELADSTYQIIGHAVDRAGNRNRTEDRFITVDSTFDDVNPDVEFVDPTPANESSVAQSSLTINVSSSDNRGDHYAFVDFDDDVLLWYRFDDVNSTGHPIDLSSYGDNGTLVGGTVINTSGRFGNGSHFDGADDYIDLFDVESAFSNGLGFCGWVYWNSFTESWSRVFDFGQGQADDNILFAHSGTTSNLAYEVYVGGTGGNQVIATDALFTGIWQHLCVSQNASGHAWLYVNGSHVVNGTANSPAAVTRQDAYIGRSAWAGDGYLNGGVDEFILFNRSIGANEVASLYNASATQYINTFESPDGQYSFIGYAVDTSGNLNSTEIRSLSVLAGNPPSIEFVDPTPANDSTQLTGDVFVNVSTSDVDDHYTFVDLDGSVVLWMRMDDVNSTGDPIDFTDNGNNGSLEGNALINSTGYWGDASHYDGTGDYINLPASNSLVQNEDAWTISTWFNAENVSSSSLGNRIITLRNSSSLSAAALALGSNDKVQFFYRDQGGTGTTEDIAAVTITDWYHYAVTYNGSASHIYINGVLNLTVIDTIAPTSSHEARIAANPAGSTEYFNGSIDEVIIFNRSLDSNEISALYNASANQYNHNFTGLQNGLHTFTGYGVDRNGNVNQTEGREITVDNTLDSVNAGIEFVDPTPANDSIRHTDDVYVNVSSSDLNALGAVRDHYVFVDFDNSLVLWMRMDDVNGTGHPTDISGYENNGSLEGGALINSTGYWGNASHYDGVGDYIHVPNDQSLRFGTYNFTFSFWFNAAEIPPSDSGQLIAKRTSGVGNYEAQLEPSGRVRSWIGQSSSINLDSSTVTSANTWYHVVVARGGGNLSMYINGVIENSTSSTHNVDSSSDLNIGRDPSSSTEHFNGTIDDVLIFNRSLAADEILSLYNATANQYGYNFTGIRHGRHEFTGYAVDLKGNKNQTEDREFIFNILPIPQPDINSSDHTNLTTQDLHGFDTLIDPDGNAMNVSVRWFNNSVFSLEQDYNNSYANGTFFVATLGSGNTSKGDNWTFAMRLFDGYNHTEWTNSTNLTILNTIPGVPTPISPGDANTTTDRTPNFTWSSGGDDDSDTLTYELNVTLIAASTCSDSSKHITSISDTSHELTTELACFYDNNDYYNWSVRAYDGEDFSDWSAPFRANLSAVIDVSLPVNSVIFGSIDILGLNDTTDDSPPPFTIQNDGNAFVNITISASDLWSVQANPTSYYQYKVDNNTAENGSFTWGLSTTDFTSIPAVDTLAIAQLNYTNATDSAEIDIRVQVPPDEPAGERNSTVTFISSLAE